MSQNLYRTFLRDANVLRRKWARPDFSDLILLVRQKSSLGSQQDEIRQVDIPHRISSQWLINARLSQYVEHNGSSGSLMSRSNQFSVCFLGTGSGVSSPRGPSATALRWDGTTYLFDAGEGTLNRTENSTITLSSITKIFITHLHLDHIFGIPAILTSLERACRDSQKHAKLCIYGPVGLFNFISSTLYLSYSELRNLTVEVYELVGGPHRSVLPGFVKNYAEFRHPALVRKSISANWDGTWTLETAQEIKTPEDALSMSSKPAGLNVWAAELNHIPKLQCFGYVIQEPFSQPRIMDVQKAAALDLKPSIKFKLLKSGFSVTNDKKTQQVHPDQVTIPGHRPRKVAILGDCQGIYAPMAGLCRFADLLIHEATWMEQDLVGENQTHFRGGHSTAAMAGKFAEVVGARVLALNHITAKVSVNQELQKELLEEARRSVDGTTQVQLTYDQMEIVIPQGGFTSEILSLRK